jgi:RHH-type proline utilization regulon transcriptional repressor/proline dehydrogenase/delta 1-pyrroline-5-carboxylate dehydrogenase
VHHLGVASHNFFTLGYAYLLSQKNKVDEFVTFEMLEGMANHLPRVMRTLGKQIILYTPVVKKEHFLNAVSYLVRRLDENTGKDNFLSYSFNLKADSEHWQFLQEQFVEAYKLKESVSTTPRRTQNRNLPAIPQTDLFSFRNEPDTNFDLKPNRLWADEIRRKWKKSVDDKPYHIPLQIGEKEVISENKRTYLDRSQNSEICVCEASLANLDQVKEILAVADNKRHSDGRRKNSQHLLKCEHYQLTSLWLV